MANKFWGFFKGVLLRKEASAVSYAAENEGAIYNNNNLELRTQLAGADREIVTEDQTQTLTNKTINADSNTITNIENADIKAGAAIDASKIADGSVSNTEFQYLANVTSDIQSQFSGTASAADVADLVTLSGVASGSEDLGTFTGATIPDNSDNKEAFQALETAHEAHVNDSSAAHAASAVSNTPSGNLAATDVQGALNELQSDVDTRATSSALTTHTGASTGVHGVTGSVVGTSDTQTLSAKTFSDAVTLAEISTPTTPSSGFGKVYFKADGSLYQLSDSGAETKVGSGSGSKNYISNFDAAQGTTGYATYADAAGTSPVDGTGGSPSVTFAANTSSPLSGAADFLFTKDAANRQGQGVSYAFTIDNADRASVLRIAFDYSTSASFADADMRMYIYDVTNSRLIEGVPVEIGANAQGHFASEFQTSPDSTSYRLIFHVASTNASAYTLNFDNVVVGPQSVVKGPIVTDWVSFTPTGGFSTNSTYTGKYRRVGDNLEVSAKIAFSGAPNSTDCTFNLPSGLSIDSNKVLSTTPQSANFGTGNIFDTSAGFNYVAQVTYHSSTAIRLRGGNGSSNVSDTSPITFANGDTIEVIFRVPISGWSSNQVLSQDNGQRVVSFSARRSSSDQSITTATETKVQFNSVSFDSTNSFSTSTYRFTAPENGFYFLSATCQINNSTQDTLNSIRIKKNGTTDLVVKNEDKAYASFYASANAVDQAIKGDYYEVYMLSNDTSYEVVNSVSSFFSGFKIQSAQQIAASEVIACSYETNAGQAVANNTVTLVTYEDKSFDTHNIYNTSTGEGTVPVSGKYTLSASVYYDGSTDWAVGESANIRLEIDRGSGFNTEAGVELFPPTASSAVGLSIGANKVFDLVKGNKFRIRTYQVSGNSRNLIAVAAFNYMSFARVGGVE